jgi:gamma-glutamyl:cysteine ligase YbdK (ATP-grasp superfamily)
LEENSPITNHAEEIKQNILYDNKRNNPLFLVGIEIEGCLLNDKGFPVDAASLIEESLNTKYPLDYEYGKCQFEFKTDPLSFYELPKINDITQDFVEGLDNLVNKAYPNQNVIPVFLGANPSPVFSDEKIITNKPRYKKISEWQSAFPDAQMDGQTFKSNLIGTAIQGFHFHLQGKDADNTVHMFNHILNLIPSCILLGANSRLLAGRTYSVYEPRIFLFDQAEGQNSGFPAISKYLDNLEEYVNYIASRQPILASNYYELEKERHDDVRIRITNESYRVETRILSVQPTAKELMCMIEFFIGYLHHTISEQRPLRPLPVIREERMSTIRSGFNAQGVFDLTENIMLELDFAKKGLNDLNVNPEFIDILQRRLDNKTSAGEVVVDIWDKKFNGSVEKTVVELASEIWEHTKNNKPIT